MIAGVCGFNCCVDLFAVAKNRIHYGLMDITLPHYHHYADISEGIELIKCLSDIFCLECVSKIRSVLSIMLHAIYGAACIQLTQLSNKDCENTFTWSYHDHQIESMTIFYNGMRCMSFYILTPQTPNVYFPWRTQHENIPNTHGSAYCR